MVVDPLGWNIFYKSGCYHFESKITIQIYDVGWNLKGELLYKVGMWSSHNSKLNDKSAIYLYFVA